MPDFLTDPFVVFLILYGLFRLLRGKKQETPASDSTVKRSSAAEEARRRALKRQPPTAATPYEQRLEEIARQYEMKKQMAAASATVHPGVTEEVAVEHVVPQRVMPERPTLEDAARAIETMEGASASAFDLNQKAFEFRSVLETPVETAFHLDSFSGFRSATGVQINTASVESIEEREDAMDDLFGSPDELRRAFVISEVLGRPRALRRLELR